MANSHTLGTDYSPRMRCADIEVPNTAVDMNSWAVSACYPQSTFYPLSDGPSIWNHRITMTCFRTCSRCTSRSQAGLCHCTDLSVSDRDQPTFVLLRYTLGGDRPSQTSHQTLSSELNSEVRTSKLSGRYFKDDSTKTSVFASMSPAYPAQTGSRFSVKLQ